MLKVILFNSYTGIAEKIGKNYPGEKNTLSKYIDSVTES